MRPAILAATGQLGSAIVAATVASIGADNVVALARTPSKAQHLGVEVRPGDYNDRDQLEQSLVGIDAVLLVSGMDAPDKRISQHRDVIEAARAAGVSKIVYTSVQGPEANSSFAPIVLSNRQTEEDVKASGLNWVIGRNGIYIEPDVEYVDTYIERGEVANCAGDGLCGYTTRAELGAAYSRLLTDSSQDGNTLNLNGVPMTQAELAARLSDAFGAPIAYRAVTAEEFRADRVADLGEFMGTVIAGIYEGIRDGAYDAPSGFEAAAGRAHISWDDYFAGLVARRGRGRRHGERAAVAGA